MLNSYPYEENKPYWEVVLSDGQIVAQDDGRPNIQPYSAWVRLGNYLREQTHLKIVEYGLRYGALYYPMPKNKEGYFFSKGAIQVVVGKQDMIEYYILGYKEGDSVTTYSIKLPDMVVMDIQNRALADCKFPALLT